MNGGATDISVSVATSPLLAHSCALRLLSPLAPLTTRVR